jgi:hypothetical protein
MSEDFLARWSRRKQEARRQEGEPAPPRVPETEPPAPAGAPEAGAQEAAGAAEAELGEEDILRLPSIDDLTADSDITVFMRKGVPEKLRNAALRRMWSLDPNIRDFVSEAREYAYDWNAPDGIPGFGGALPPPDEIEKLAARIVGAGKGDSPESSGSSPRAGAVSQNRESASRESVADEGAASQPQGIEPAALNSVQPPQLRETVAVEPVTAKARDDEGAAGSKAAPQHGAQQEFKPLKPRRHGGARPL